MIEIRWHARGGQGAFTASKLFGETIALHENRYALAFPSFGPERRGAPVLAFTKIDDQKIRDRSEINLCDYIVILDETLFKPQFFSDLKPNGKIVLNTGKPENYKDYVGDSFYTIDAAEMAYRILAKPIVNTAVIGALAAISGLTSNVSVGNALSHYFKADLLDRNKKVVDEAFNASLNKEGV